MRIGSLFSGAGGLDMAVEAVFGGTVVWHSEIDKAASKVLAHRYPDVPNLGDITEINWDNWKPMLEVDILCGGFPCQDVSSAGKRAGIKSGTRSGLWSVFAEAIDTLRPSIVIIENVRGLLSAQAHRNVESEDPVVGDGERRPVLRAAGAVFGDLSDIGYDAAWTTLAAGDIGAPHRRERVFIVATDTSGERHGGQQDTGMVGRLGGAEASSARERERSRGVPGDRDEKASGGRVNLLPTPRSSDCFGAGLQCDGGMDLRTTVTLLPTPTAVTSRNATSGRKPGAKFNSGTTLDDVAFIDQWGKYAAAIRRWETINGPAPKPTEPNTKGKPRLNPEFSSWMMGWPPGWVTAPEIGISRNDQLKIVGNGVCPQQAAAALRYLLAVATDNTHTPEVSDVKTLMPTPRATDGTKGGPNQRGSSGDLMLPSAVCQMDRDQ
jgi:DNA (cytosine-5)-methyltransferase 1